MFNVIKNNSKNKLDLLTIYQAFFAVIAAAIWYSFIDTYGNLAFGGVVPKQYLFVLTTACVPLLPSFLSDFKYLKKIELLLFWCAGYIAISAISFLSLPVSREVISDELEFRVLAVGVMLVSLVFFSKSDRVLTIVRMTILAVTLFSIGNNFYEFLNPEIFADFNLTGRPAGFYLDANASGFAIIIGTLFSIGLLNPVCRFLLLIAAGAGVFITASRGSLIIFTIMAIILILTRTLSRKQLVVWIIGLIIITTLASFLQLDIVQKYLWQLQQQGVLNESVFARLNIFGSGAPTGGETDDSRATIIGYALRLFSQKPFLGHGIGYTRIWDGEIRPHNMYLLFIVEHGFLGILFMPLLIWFVTRNAKGEAKSIATAYAILMLIRCIFSHNVLEERFSIISFSLMMAITAQSVIKYEKYKSKE